MGQRREKFSGFPPGRFSMTSLPAPFFSELLPLIDDLAELKVLLFCFWALPQKEGRFAYLRRRDFVQNEALMRGLAVIDPHAGAEVLLDVTLAGAAEHGTLLRAEVTLADERAETLYFVNTARGRAAVEQLAAGRWQPGDLENPVEILPERPNIYQLYERNIGPLTPMITDELKDAEKEFPAEWLEEAMRVAVAANKRSLRYIRAILERWRGEGKDHDEADQGNRGQAGKRYISGEYADFIEH
jgi:DNA replication protein